MNRLSRSLKDLLTLYDYFQEKGVFLISIQEPWLNTNKEQNAMSEFLFLIFGALGQFDRKGIIERTRAGLEAAKKKGVRLGRTRTDESLLSYAYETHKKGKKSVAMICKEIKISRTTYYRYLKNNHFKTPYEEEVFQKYKKNETNETKE